MKVERDDRAKASFTAALCAAFAMIAYAEPYAHAGQCDSAITQADMNRCSARELHLIEAQVKRQYSALMKRASDTATRIALRASQSAWEQYRDRQCDLATLGVIGGSFYPTAVATCLTELTKNRKSELDKLANCQEGNIGCPTFCPEGNIGCPHENGEPR